MPDLNEFLNKPNVSQEHLGLEKIDGVRACSKCELDVDGALWDIERLLLTWTCNNGHSSNFQVG